ncbi:MAG TPA: hypothetical protein VGW10_17125, partial [Solirubrobacteraceae bacterium]|nr:hypothetical protein [Solirubrobacteraceae bacterium]
PGVEPRDIRFADGLVLVPLVGVILLLALYPQIPLEKGENTIPGKVQAARQALDGGGEAVAQP